MSTKVDFSTERVNVYSWTNMFYLIVYQLHIDVAFHCLNMEWIEISERKKLFLPVRKKSKSGKYKGTCTFISCKLQILKQVSRYTRNLCIRGYRLIINELKMNYSYLFTFCGWSKTECNTLQNFGWIYNCGHVKSSTNEVDEIQGTII